MSTATLVIGNSGSGKTASLRNLNPADTLLIQPVKKPLPFKAAGWSQITDANKTGNIYATDDSARIVAAMHKTKRPVIVVDDFQYILANEFMRRSEERGYDKFTDIGRHAWDVLKAASELPDMTRVYIMGHTQTDDFGKVSVKTIGKMLDEKIVVEGMFSIVLKTVVTNGQYKFSTRNNGSDPVKSPIGLFDDEQIDNDLAAVDAAICSYFNVPLAA